MPLDPVSQLGMNATGVLPDFDCLVFRSTREHAPSQQKRTGVGLAVSLEGLAAAWGTNEDEAIVEHTSPP